MRFWVVFRSERAVSTTFPPYIMPNGTYERIKKFYDTLPLKVACTRSFLMYMQIFFFPSLYHSHGHIWAKISRYAPPLTPKKRPKTDPYRPKMAKRVVLPHFCERVVLPHFRERVDESPRQDENFGTFGLFLSFFVSELRPFKVKDKFFQCIFEALFINSANALLLTAVLWMLVVANI